MKVLYDITVLGIGHRYTSARAGVFRVVENVAYGLKNSKECELVFYINGDDHNLYATLDYLEDNPELAKVVLSHGNLKFKQSLYKIQRQINLKIDTTSKVAKIPLKVIRKSVSYVDRIAEKISKSIDVKNSDESHIYHSPYFPIPPQIRKAKNIKKILTIHDLIPILHPEYFKSSEQNIDDVKKALSSLDQESWVLCVSQSTKDDLCNYSKNINCSRVFVTYLAASNFFFPCRDYQKNEVTRRKYHIPNAPYILSLSTLEPRKNIEHTIRCFIKLVQQEKIQDLYLVLAGAKGWNYNKIFAEISSNPSLKERIVVTGYVADEDLAALYSGAVAFVYPSFYEGFGLPPLEAMQCGVPVITSNISSLPELVGDAGIMLDPKDTDGLCHSMFELYKKPSLRQSMSFKSLEQAKKFSWEKCTQKTIAAYKTALSG